MSTNQTPKKTPDFNIFAKIPIGVESKIGSQIGVAFKHKEGAGFNIILDSSPIPFDGRIELIAFAVDKD